MVVRVVSTTGAQSTGGGGTVTTPEIDTTGADALFFYTNSYGIVANVFDSAGNTWLANPPTLFSTIVPPHGADGILWYALPPVSTSAHHTFWAGGIGITFQVAAFAGIATTLPYDTESAGSAVSTGTSVSTGSVTPHHDNSLIIAVTGEGWSGPLTVDSGFTILGTPRSFVTDTAFAAGWAWQVQSTATTVNPTFHFSSIATSYNAQARAAVFGATGPSGPTPPPTPMLAMDDVVCTASGTTLSRHLISLRWSDDRGHVYGSPVTQDIGEAGEYLTSLQWQRLSYARDRVFELSWSVPMRTALLGAWIDVTPAQS